MLWNGWIMTVLEMVEWTNSDAMLDGNLLDDTRRRNHSPTLFFLDNECSSLDYSLYVKGRVLGHKRGKRNSRPNTSLVQLEGVDSKEAAQFYLGKVSRDATSGQAGISGRGVNEWPMMLEYGGKAG